jgi:hypothetical protein
VYACVSICLFILLFIHSYYLLIHFYTQFSFLLKKQRNQTLIFFDRSSYLFLLLIIAIKIGISLIEVNFYKYSQNSIYYKIILDKPCIQTFCHQKTFSFNSLSNIKKIIPKSIVYSVIYDVIKMSENTSLDYR